VPLILSSMGGIFAFISGTFLVIRAITRNVTATRDNTEALTKVEQVLKELGSTVDEHTVRLAVLEDRRGRRAP
jgi:UDP-N-acetylglucosamine enolpyruvyl transferase